MTTAAASSAAVTAAAVVYAAVAAAFTFAIATTVAFTNTAAVAADITAATATAICMAFLDVLGIGCSNISAEAHKYSSVIKKCCLSCRISQILEVYSCKSLCSL